MSSFLLPFILLPLSLSLLSLFSPPFGPIGGGGGWGPEWRRRRVGEGWSGDGGVQAMAATACPVIGGLEEDAGVEEPRAADGELVERGPRPGRVVRGGRLDGDAGAAEDDTGVAGVGDDDAVVNRDRGRSSSAGSARVKRGRAAGGTPP
uniref:Transposon protein, putative, unclassified n=1 Tax=Oryza sativa subsp. japonica TaxID=39947 RepID=Q2QTN0_ORYSJ|nr:transposon protein, putative, unclassified [Oryza sativa Japonica Group]